MKRLRLYTIVCDVLVWKGSPHCHSGDFCLELALLRCYHVHNHLTSEDTQSFDQ
jgi:hypothetical protein